MALHAIQHACGHTSEQQIYGTDVNGERGKEAARRGRRQCDRCLQQEYDERNQVAAAHAEAEGWPVLTGSSKQRAWAQSLRQQAVDSLRNEAQAVGAGGANIADLATRLLVDEHTDASWWIDHRSRRNWLSLIANEPEWVAAVQQSSSGTALGLVAALRQQIVAEIAVRTPLQLVTDQGWSITVEGEMVMQWAPGREAILDGTDSDQVGTAARMLRGLLVVQAAVREGALLVEFAGGMRLRVNADATESWQVTGPGGQRLVCAPGGELVVWAGE